MDIPAWLRTFLQNWVNVKELLWHVEQGQTLTLIRSDGPFEVPATLPGGAVTIESVQYTFNNGDGVALARVLERE